VDCAAVRILHDGQHSSSGADARQVPHELWGALEAALQADLELNANAAWSEGDCPAARGHRRGGLGKDSSSMLYRLAALPVCNELHLLPLLLRLSPPAPSPRPSMDPPGGSRARLAEDGPSSRCCCVGEAVVLEVELSNPLQLDLSLTRLRLTCTWEPANGGTGDGEGGPSAAMPSPPAGGHEQQPQGFRVGAWCCRCCDWFEPS
jgi:hypothetical protein